MQKILVIDYGSQYTHLITNRLRSFGVYSEIVPAPNSFTKADVEEIKNDKEIRGIILSGGPNSVYDEGGLRISEQKEVIDGFFGIGVPILGVCYGHQLIAHSLGGKVSPGEVKEYGLGKIKITGDNSKLFKGVDGEFVVWMSHGDEVSALPEGFETIGSTKDCHNTAVENKHTDIYGIQFHPEVAHTQNGNKIMENFLNICKISKDWSMEAFLKLELDEVKDKVGDKNVFLMISGGVDSTVAYFLLKEAIGASRIFPLFVDTGFMRKNEASKVRKMLEDAGVEHLKIEDASERYFKALQGITDPEKKRKIIGDLFIEVQKDAVKSFGLDEEHWLLGQGTIYPDTIESGGTKHADKIKTHHNRVPEIERLIELGLVIEPIAMLYKDEVREIGRLLGVPSGLVDRHPFPGPGLAVRCLCSDNSATSEKLGISIGKGGIYKNGKNGLLFNYSIHILPVQSVGVQGDNRTYRHPAIISGKFPGWNVLDDLSTSLTNGREEINRVLYEIINEKLEIRNFRIKKSFLTKSRISLLQEIDDMVEGFLNENKNDSEIKKIWQFPVVLVPVSSDGEKESIVLRPINSTEAMTANFAHIDYEKIKQLALDILEKHGDKIENVFYDITNKPPGTIEWE